jgi:hypothetical protein
MKYEFDVGYDRITNFDAPGYEPKEISTFLTRAQEEIVYDILDASAYDEKNKKALSRLRQVIPLSIFVAGNYPNGFSTPLQVSVGGTGIQFVVGAEDSLQSSTDNFFTDAGFREGDLVIITGATTAGNNGTFHIIEVREATGSSKLIISDQESFASNEGSVAATLVTTNAILRVRNERADIVVTAGNFYFGKLDVGGPDENKIFDIEVDPTDDDFYNANKDNPYKKPSIEKIWRIDSANESSKEHEYITDGTFTLTTVHLHFDRKPRAIIVPDAGYTKNLDGTIDGIYFIDYLTGLDCLLDPIIHREIVDRGVKLAYAALQDEKGFQISSIQEQQEK